MARKKEDDLYAMFRGPEVPIIAMSILLIVIGGLIFSNIRSIKQMQNEWDAPELHEGSVVIAAQLPAPQPTLTSVPRPAPHICAMETETEVPGVQTEVLGVQTEITTTLSHTLYLPLVICPKETPLPAACYTTTPLLARKQCLLVLNTTYVISFTAWQHSDLFIGFPIEQQIHAVVDNYSKPAADVDLRFWGENSQGSNVPGPFHPAAPGGPINATWTPEYPYYTPGIYLVELFAYTPYDFTVRLRVEKE